MFTTNKKNAVGDKSGNITVKNLRQNRAPSIAAASTTERGTDCSAAKKNRKL